MIRRFLRRLLIIFTIVTLLSADDVGVYQIPAGEELKGLWVCTVLNLDYPSRPTWNAARLMQQADSLLNEAKRLGFNAVFLQVRPSSDAIYPSRYYPWSKYLTGVQGAAPSDEFDPLEYWITGAHNRGMQLHAWINPFRVTADASNDINALIDSHPARRNPEWVVAHSDGKHYFDPGIPEVRRYIIDAAVELVQNYDVDGLHLDDYFYPDPYFDDSKSYAEYGGGQDVHDWRRSNINTFVRELGEAVRATGKYVEYGISPMGIWANYKNDVRGSGTDGAESYSLHYADSYEWIKQGYIDYICPQLYWRIGYQAADYKVLLKWWADVTRGSGVTLYIGMAGYRVTEGWPADEITRQLQLNRDNNVVAGAIHFRAKFYMGDDRLQQTISALYK